MDTGYGYMDMLDIWNPKVQKKEKKENCLSVYQLLKHYTLLKKRKAPRDAARGAIFLKKKKLFLKLKKGIGRMRPIHKRNRSQ